MNYYVEVSAWNWDAQRKVGDPLLSLLIETSFTPHKTMRGCGFTTLKTPSIPASDGGREITERLLWLLCAPKGSRRATPFYRPLSFASIKEDTRAANASEVIDAKEIAALVPDNHRELDGMGNSEYVAHIQKHGYAFLQPLKAYQP